MVLRRWRRFVSACSVPASGALFWVFALGHVFIAAFCLLVLPCCLLVLFLRSTFPMADRVPQRRGYCNEVCLSVCPATGRARRPFSPAAGAASAPLVLAALRAGVVAKFWALLRDFADLGVPRKGWDGVSAGHPFLRVANGRLISAE